MDEEVSLGVPEPILDSLPDDDEAAATDMRQAVGGLEHQINEAVAAADDEREAAGVVVDAIERLEEQLEQYDDLVPELRAWGQSPVYAVAWRNLQADLVLQLQGHDWLEGHVDRERHRRLVEDGIRFGGR
jgi:nucleotide-binding universal stress UspA family protein